MEPNNNWELTKSMIDWLGLKDEIQYKLEGSSWVELRERGESWLDMKSGGNFVGGWKKRVHGRGEGYGIVNYCLKDNRIHELRSLLASSLAKKKKTNNCTQCLYGC